MRAVLQIAWLCLVSGAFAQTLNLPPRGTSALDGKAFAEKTSALSFAEREQEIYSQVTAGNVPAFLRKFCPVTVTNVAAGITNVATFFVAPEYLAIGSDEDYFLTPMSPGTAQRIADQLGCVLPTRKMVDAICTVAEVRLAPSPIPPSAAMTTVPVFAQHNETVLTQRVALVKKHPLGALVVGHKKDVVISTRLGGVTNKVAIYGWQQTNGAPIQPLYLGHTAAWVDYSHGIRLVKLEMIVNGETKSVADVLADPKLCGLISDEGVITNTRYPTNPVAPAASVKIDLPWPEEFTASPHFGEMNREIALANGVRMLINAPSQESFAPDKPVLLIFFALPNGNTIEQTIGKALKPGDDWHFDIQHIGAQTRFLRAALTNRTVVVAYLEAATKSWPAWRKNHDDPSIARILDGVRGIFAGRKLEVVLTGHSGGGSLTFGYLNVVDKIPDDVVRIAFLDSNYAYETTNHLTKLVNWLQRPGKNDVPLTPSLSPSDGERVAFRPGEGSGPYLCVLAYHDSVALLNGRTFVSAQGGTWGRSHAMLEDLGAQFKFTSRTNGGLETFSALGGRIQFLLKENPEKKVLHTVQVERNGFIQALVAGTAEEGRGYEYFGGRAYTVWIQAE